MRRRNAYEGVMDEAEERFSTIENIYVGMYVAFEKGIRQQEEEMAARIKEETADRRAEAQERDVIEANRAARKERQLQNETLLIEAEQKPRQPQEQTRSFHPSFPHSITRAKF